MGIIIDPYRFGVAFSNLYGCILDASNEYLIKTGFSVTGLGAFTVAVRAKSSSAIANRYLMSMPENSGGSNGCDLYFSVGSALRGTVKTTTTITLDTGIAYNDGVMRTYILWYDGTNAKIYVDNVEKATQAKTGTVALTANEFDLNRFGSFGLYLGATYDEVSVWSIALDSTGRGVLNTPSNLLLHPNFSTSNCMAWYRCGDDPLDNLTGTTGTVRDQTGNGRHLTPFLTEVGDKVLI